MADPALTFDPAALLLLREHGICLRFLIRMPTIAIVVKVFVVICCYWFIALVFKEFRDCGKSLAQSCSSIVALVLFASASMVLVTRLPP